MKTKSLVSIKKTSIFSPIKKFLTKKFFIFFLINRVSKAHCKFFFDFKINLNPSKNSGGSIRPKIIHLGFSFDKFTKKTKHKIKNQIKIMVGKIIIWLITHLPIVLYNRSDFFFLLISCGDRAKFHVDIFFQFWIKFILLKIFKMILTLNFKNKGEFIKLFLLEIKSNTATHSSVLLSFFYNFYLKLKTISKKNYIGLDFTKIYPRIKILLKFFKGNTFGNFLARVKKTSNKQFHFNLFYFMINKNIEKKNLYYEIIVLISKKNISLEKNMLRSKKISESSTKKLCCCFTLHLNKKLNKFSNTCSSKCYKIKLNFVNTFIVFYKIKLRYVKLNFLSKKVVKLTQKNRLSQKTFLLKKSVVSTLKKTIKWVYLAAKLNPFSNQFITLVILLEKKINPKNVLIIKKSYDFILFRARRIAQSTVPLRLYTKQLLYFGSLLYFKRYPRILFRVFSKLYLSTTEINFKKIFSNFILNLIIIEIAYVYIAKRCNFLTTVVKYFKNFLNKKTYERMNVSVEPIFRKKKIHLSCIKKILNKEKIFFLDYQEKFQAKHLSIFTCTLQNLALSTQGMNFKSHIIELSVSDGGGCFYKNYLNFISRIITLKFFSNSILKIFIKKYEINTQIDAFRDSSVVFYSEKINWKDYLILYNLFEKKTNSVENTSNPISFSYNLNQIFCFFLKKFNNPINFLFIKNQLNNGNSFGKINLFRIKNLNILLHSNKFFLKEKNTIILKKKPRFRITIDLISKNLPPNSFSLKFIKKKN